MSVTTVETIDTHTLGEPTRIVLGGFPRLRGRTLAERSDDLLRRHDGMRRTLMLEPRGHRFMFGAVVVPPAHPGADLGLVFMDTGGAVRTCVHGTIGAVTALVESGRLRPSSSRLLVDTPERPVEVRLRRAGKRVREVSLLAPPARVVRRGLRTGEASRPLPYDLAYAGNLVAVLEAGQAGLELEPDRATALIELGMRLKAGAQEAWCDSAGAWGPWPEVVSSVFYQARGPGLWRDFVVFRQGGADRSPCGSCFGALMALLHEDGRLALDEWTECENLLGLSFRGRLLPVGGDLVPELVGSAFVTGEHRFRIDSRDPLRSGFLL